MREIAEDITAVITMIVFVVVVFAITLSLVTTEAKAQECTTTCASVNLVTGECDVYITECSD